MRRFRDVRFAFRRENWLLGSVFAILSVASAPIGILMDALSLCLRKTPNLKKGMVDIWHLAWLVISILVLFYWIPKWPYVAWILFLKVVDLIHTMLMLMVFKRYSEGKVRPIVHLMVHYIQLLVTFACLFLWVQSHCHQSLFILKNVLNGTTVDTTTNLSPGDALYFSLVAAATVGFGDIVPLSPTAGSSCGFWYCQPSLYVGLEVLLAIGLTLFFIPYFLSLVPRKQVQPPEVIYKRARRISS